MWLRRIFEAIADFPVIAAAVTIVLVFWAIVVTAVIRLMCDTLVKLTQHLSETRTKPPENRDQNPVALPRSRRDNTH